MARRAPLVWRGVGSDGLLSDPRQQNAAPSVPIAFAKGPWRQDGLAASPRHSQSSASARSMRPSASGRFSGGRSQACERAPIGCFSRHREAGRRRAGPAEKLAVATKTRSSIEVRRDGSGSAKTPIRRRMARRGRRVAIDRSRQLSRSYADFVTGGRGSSRRGWGALAAPFISASAALV